MQHIRSIALFLMFNALLVGGLHAQAVEIWQERARTAIAAERFEEAIEQYEKILAREPDNAAVRYQMARAYYAMGNKRAADRSIVRAVRLEPENIEYLEFQLEIGFVRELLEILRSTRKNELAAKILLLDSLSVPANLQLAEKYMREWNEWRGRLEIEGMDRIENVLGDTRPTQNNVDVESDRNIDDKTSSNELPIHRETLTAEPFELEQLEIRGHTIINLNGRALDAYPLAQDHLEKVLMRDPQNEQAYLNLAHLYLTAPDVKQLQRMAGQMRDALPENHYAWLFSGYALHKLENVALAERYFNKALELMPDSMLAVYTNNQQLMNKAGAARYASAGIEKGDYWQFRDPRLLTPENERLTEHYSRIVYSDLIFSEPRLDLAGWDSERGEIFIRYGAPSREYFMTNAVTDCGAATYKHFHIFEYPDQKFVFGTLWPQLNEYIFYSPCSQVMGNAVGVELDYDIIAEAQIREKPEDYYYDADGKRTEFPHLTSLFKGDNGKVDVYVPYGIPVRFNAMTLTQRLDLESGVFLLDEMSGIVGEDRTKATDIRSRDLTIFKSAALWIDTHALKVEPGTYDLSIEFETESGAGIGFYRAPLDVPGYYGGSLQISDLLMAYIVEEAGPDVAEPPTGMILRDGLLIRPAPWGVFKREQPMYLFFEMYNLQKNAEGRAQYEVEAVMLEYQDDKGLARLIRRAFRGRGQEGVSVRFENSTINTDESQYLIMDAVDQPAGTYVIVMRVTDKIAQKTVETRRIVLLE